MYEKNLKTDELIFHGFIEAVALSFCIQCNAVFKLFVNSI